MEFYDTDLVIANIIILWMLYLSCISIFSNKNTIKSRFICIHLLRGFISKNKKNTLSKKISTLFVIVTSIQFIFVFLTMVVSQYWPVYALTRALYLSIASMVCYSYIYKKIEEKIDYIEYIERNIKDIEKGDLEHELDVIGNDELASIAQSVNNISDGLNKALESQLKGERTKQNL
ncbi:hypothetical protein QJS64_07265 [Paraclostridium bifermentans]|uniref:HAMP domain-containing protein n=1 Tax=Paraclostridium bifermentans TaxID=1490 RepID=A0ABY8R5K4_PARBF|nr:hypothetical protein QJS64_07265 [Paraclostridium bifermentans]